MVDTTFVQPISDLITNPNIQHIVITAIIAGLTFVFGLLRIPKTVAANIVHYGVIIISALVQSTRQEYMTKAKIYTNEELNSMAANFLDKAIDTNAKSSFFRKVTNILGGTGKVISFAYPIAKPLLKNLFK